MKAMNTTPRSTQQYIYRFIVMLLFVSLGALEAQAQVTTEDANLTHAHRETNQPLAQFGPSGTEKSRTFDNALSGLPQIEKKRRSGNASGGSDDDEEDIVIVVGGYQSVEGGQLVGRGRIVRGGLERAGADREAAPFGQRQRRQRRRRRGHRDRRGRLSVGRRRTGSPGATIVLSATSPQIEKKRRSGNASGGSDDDEEDIVIVVGGYQSAGEGDVQHSEAGIQEADVQETAAEELPRRATLLGNYPNPFETPPPPSASS